MFLDEEIIDLMRTETEKYALFLNYENPNITASDLKAFLGILLLSGYNNLPGKRLYWDSLHDMRIQMVYETMRRERFSTIMRFIHFADNNFVPQGDKMWKLRPLITKVKRNFMRYFEPSQNLSFDESMIKYCGKHGCKQFIRGKPIRFGFKAWCLSTTDGYLILFDVYQGKNVHANVHYEEEFGKCAAVLVSMIDEFLDEKKNFNYNFFFDNLKARAGTSLVTVDIILFKLFCKLISGNVSNHTEGQSGQISHNPVFAGNRSVTYSAELTNALRKPDHAYNYGQDFNGLCEEIMSMIRKKLDKTEDKEQLWGNVDWRTVEETSDADVFNLSPSNVRVECSGKYFLS